MEKKQIKHIGYDAFGRELFKTRDGKIVCDVAMDYTHSHMDLATKRTKNGEPEYGLNSEEYEVVDKFKD